MLAQKVPAAAIVLIHGVCSSECRSLRSLVEHIGPSPSSAQELLGGWDLNFFLLGWGCFSPTSLLSSPHSQGVKVSQKTWVQVPASVVTGLGNP